MNPVPPAAGNAGRWAVPFKTQMLIKTITIIVVVCLAITVSTIMVSCMPSTKVHLATLTPIVTATPIAFGADNRDINQTIRDTYKGNPACKSYNAMNVEQDVLEFFDATDQINFDRLLVHEVADSMNNKYRAYLVTDPTLNLNNCEVGCFPERIYIKDVSKGEVRGFNWNGYIPGRITYKLVWIGDSILAFQQNVNPYNSEMIVIDIEQQIIIFRSFESCNYMDVTPTP